ncbi:MAG: peptidase S58 family protein [Acidimicrobiia bacterium]|nr:peptidase S58 family protein [Acidimicrobiia bacterium]
MSLTDIEGFRVGHATDHEAMTGCTVILPPADNVTAVEVRGAAPGTRDLALLGPGMTVRSVDAILLSGGSAYGLAAADGVMTELEKQGVGHIVPNGVVPIVPGAVIYDLMVGDPKVRPDAEMGRTALLSADGGPIQTGRVGVGAGATVGKWRGELIPSGLGGATVRVGDAIVAALAVTNAVGDVFTLEGEALTGGDIVPDPIDSAGDALANTTLVVVATNGTITREDLSRVLVRAHDALAVTIRPAHTGSDGDTIFAVCTGQTEADHEIVASAAFVAVGRAIEDSVRSAPADNG